MNESRVARQRGAKERGRSRNMKSLSTIAGLVAGLGLAAAGLAERARAQTSESAPGEAAPAPAPAPAPAADPAAPGAKPGRPEPPPAPLVERAPRGFAAGGEREAEQAQHFLPIEDRWRVGFPRWQRYPVSTADGPYTDGSAIDPYNQNVLKGDYPAFHVPHLSFPPLPHIGGDGFMVLTLQSDTIFETRSFPIPGGITTERPRSEDFFGDFDQFLFIQNGTVSLELFQGDAGFKPKDWALKATSVFNFNYVNFEERGLVDRDVTTDEDNRADGHIGFQELFAEIHLADLSVNYDTLTLTAGIQGFTSDFRGFLYTDNNLGVRLQGNALSNQIQWNLLWFHQLEKDTNSFLNTFESRDQNVFIANVFVQDFLTLGYTASLSYHLNLDDSDTHFDDNGFLTRPSPIGAVAGAVPGDIRAKELEVHYLGWAGEGHIGRLNLSHQYYYAFGRDDLNEISGRSQRIRGHMAAVEASVDIDWLRLKGSFFYQSGDRDPRDGTAAGFDTIFDNPFFAGAGFSYWNRQSVPFVQTGVQLVQRQSLAASLRSSKIEGQANFVNPGLFLFGIGASARLTPKLFADLNVNYLRFQHTEVLELTQHQDGIGEDIGLDYSLGLQYRPFLNENVIFTAGVGALTPGRGFRSIYGAETLYSAFVAATFTY